MLARDNLPKLGFSSPVCIHTPLLHGTDGSDKMSSSKENFIAIDDQPKVIIEKIKKSYCPAGETEGNPILEIAHHFIFNERETLLIQRPEKFGGNLELTQEELIKNVCRWRFTPPGSEKWGCGLFGGRSKTSEGLS
jgi:tyrosyl-tRNA synthetase